MKKWLASLVVILMLGLGAADNLFAFRCGSDLVEKGDRKIEVLRKCGEPASVDEWDEVRRIPGSRYGLLRGDLEQVRVEEWTYNFGPQRFLQIYRFENGRVTRMEFGGYGF